jgi:hypothetical protein
MIFNPMLQSDSISSFNHVEPADVMCPKRLQFVPAGRDHCSDVLTHELPEKLFLASTSGPSGRSARTSGVAVAEGGVGTADELDASSTSVIRSIGECAIGEEADEV